MLIKILIGILLCILGIDVGLRAYFFINYKTSKDFSGRELSETQIEFEYYGDSVYCKDQWRQNDIDSALVTFITPSTARNTLSRTVESVIAQSDPRWLMIIYLDGVLSSPMYLNKTSNIPIFLNTPSDRRICIRYDMKLGSSNCAGDIRNRAINESLTKWVAFVDDDDTISSRYVSGLASEDSMTPNASAIIFRMLIGGTIRPSIGINNFYLRDVGISFALKRSLFSELGRRFDPSPIEDYMFLDSLRNDGFEMILSDKVLYFVRESPSSQSFGKIPHLSIRKVPHANNTVLGWNVQSKTPEVVFLRNVESCDRFASASTISNIVFEFPEKDNLFFASNVRGLNVSIHSAIKRGCLGRVPHNIDILVTFVDTSQIPKGQSFIQVQMEQQGSRHFSSEYSNKLKQALQVWEFSPSTESYSSPHNSHFLPTFLMLDHNPFYTCNSLKKPLTSGVFKAYWKHSYYQCEVINGQLTTLSQEPSSSMLLKTAMDDIIATSGNSSGSSNRLLRQRNSKSIGRMKLVGAMDGGGVDGVNPENLLKVCESLPSFPDVLVFGAFHKAFNNSREQLCDRLIDAGISVACLEGVFRDALNHFVCHSKIIVSDHFYEHSALETHRFDPLLQVGKIVITTPSSSPSLEALYHPHLIIAEREKIVSVVQDVLSNYSSIQAEHEVKAKAFMRERMMNLDPLCAALQSLKADLSENIPKKRRFRLRME